MDSPTQMLLGAAVGQTCFGKVLGRRAAWWGAIGGTIPDLDVLVIPFTGRIGEFAYHRGPTHSLVFGPLAGPILGYLVWRWYARKPHDPASETRDQNDATFLSAWIGLFVLALFTHPLLDIFTTYGTVLYWPFSSARVALNAVPITDPLYSAILAAALIVGSRYRERPRIPQLAGAIALVLSTAYLFYGLAIHYRSEKYVAAQLSDSGLNAAEITDYPTILQLYLRRIVVRTPDAIRIGYVSMWNPRRIEWRSFSEDQHPFTNALLDTRDGRVFDWFAMKQTAINITEQEERTVIEIDDIRYGFPDTPRFGMWGIRGNFDTNGALIGPVEYYNRPPPAPVGTLLANLFTLTFAGSE